MSVSVVAGGHEGHVVEGGEEDAAEEGILRHSVRRGQFGVVDHETMLFTVAKLFEFFCGRWWSLTTRLG
jgi:hypothetical protein